MRKVIILIVVLNSSIIHSQLLEENFDYTAGTLTVQTSNWTENPTGSLDIQIISGNLTYSGYPSIDVGNKIALDGGATGRSGVVRSFTTQSASGVTVYFSFLLKVTSVTDMDISTSNGGIFANFQDAALSQSRAAVYVRQGGSSTKFSIGLGKSSSASLTWYSTELDVNTTYLIVTAYNFISGTGNDAVKLWVNPDLSGEEPASDISITSGTDADDIGHVQFRQGQVTGDMDIDGVRVATSWSQAPLPVELTSFTANVTGGCVELNWETVTEINNYGFSVERRVINEEWNQIGFVHGYGNSNSPKHYSFVEETPLPGKLQYRLKQIDFDGEYEYSETIDVIINGDAQFSLDQNYPNPFNPTTTIDYTIPNVETTGRVVFTTLKIYNILGQEISTLVNEYKYPGKYSADFNMAQISNLHHSLPSGIYFYTLQITSPASSGNTFMQTKKMIFVR
ncbi:MAG: T9SS type A sorting domain-containing protein [Ignavibacteriales bacterium]|nr:T9SS type A sorting domain-containing protein [Ignavibacteriales bacterium]